MIVVKIDLIYRVGREDLLVGFSAEISGIMGCHFSEYFCQIFVESSQHYWMGGLYLRILGEDAHYAELTLWTLIPAAIMAAC